MRELFQEDLGAAHVVLEFFIRFLALVFVALEPARLPNQHAVEGVVGHHHDEGVDLPG